MILRHPRKGLMKMWSSSSLVLFLFVFFVGGGSGLSIRREPVTEQVLVITTPDPLLQDETPSADATLETTANEGLLNDEGAAAATTTVDTLVLADSTGESWEVDPTASAIVSKDVEIEINPAISSNKIMESESGQAEPDNSKPVLPEIYSFRIQSDVMYRYSRTYVTSRVANKDSKRSHEVTFNVVLPETAFISKFIMEIDGKPYEAYVKEKEEAKKEYQQAQSQGQTAGLVEKSTRNSNVFNVNVNIKPQSKVTFNLTYEELLTRRLGRYEQAININPDQVSSIKDYQIFVNIEESRNLTFLRVPSLSNDIDGQDPNGNNPDAVIERPAPNKAKISWTPTTADQKKLVKEGISGKFVVQYDVDRDSDAGQILVMQGFFVHFFAPENLPPLKKHVVFILDISGSMWGRKMEQLKESQKKILDDLTSDDYFNIITFSSDVYLWSPNDDVGKKGSEFRQPYFPTLSATVPPELLAKRQPLPATTENIQKAKAFIDSLVASGGTNIHDAIIEALNLTAVIKEAQTKGNSPATTETDLIDTTVLPSSSSSPSTTASTTTTTNAAIKSSPVSTTTTSSSTSAPSSSTDGTEDEEESASIIIVDIAKSEPLESATDNPEVTTTLIPQEGSGSTVLPPNVQSLIIFLTDGEPTVGVTDPPEIQRLIQTANRNLSVPIFSLGFGEGADFPFLKKLSLQNHGFGRKIYEASDAALQLKGFYNEIASPLLANVTFNYTSAEFNVTDVTVTRFPTVFGGTEIAVAGKLVAPPKPERVDEEDITTISPSHDDGQQPTTELSLDDNEEAANTPDFDAPAQPDKLTIACDFELSDRYYLDVSVEGNGRDGELDLHDPEFYDRRKCGVGIEFPIAFVPPSVYPPRPTPPPAPEDIFLERLWAYLTIQQLLEQDLAEGDKDKDKGSSEDPISPSTTVSPVDADSSIVTLALPIRASPIAASPSRANFSSKPETPKERALRLALKYGFVTPLTSLVVVKPNSSDVTNAVPTDARPDAFDGGFAIASRRISFSAPILASPRILYSGGPSSNQAAGRWYSSRARSGGNNKAAGRRSHRRHHLSNQAPQSLSSAFAFAAPSLMTMSIRNKIASHPLPLPIHSTYQLSRPALPVPHVASAGGSFNHGPPSGFGGPPGGFANIAPLSLGSLDYDSDLSLSPSPPLPSTTVRPTVTTSTTEAATFATLKLNDITWLDGINDVLRVNETDYIIARQTSNDDNAGYNCTTELTNNEGRCSHLKDCVLPTITINQQLFKRSLFCPIASTSSGKSYVGVCCPSRISKTLQFSHEEP